MNHPGVHHPGVHDPGADGGSAPSRSSRSLKVQMSLHLVAAGLAAISGWLSRWSLHASGRSAFAGGWSDLLTALVVVAVLGGLLSVVLQIAALLVPGEPVRWQRLLAQVAGVAASWPAIGFIAVIGSFTMGSLLPQSGNLMGVVVILLLVASIVPFVLQRSRPSLPGSPRPGFLQERAILLLAASSALTVSFFSAWWIVNGAMLVLTLLGL